MLDDIHTATALTFRTRFAPSPTGYLHLGHAYSALLAADMSAFHQGEFILRIEDTDTARCRPEFETAIFDDLRWLGINIPAPVMRQSTRGATYQSALDLLIDKGWCFPCRCSRRDIRTAQSAPQESATGPSAWGDVYPGTCRRRSMATRQPNDSIRLNIQKVVQNLHDIDGLTFTETGKKHVGIHTLSRLDLVSNVGDLVLARRDIANVSYHLAVVVDDADQNISDVVRGRDLFEATFIHRLLQHLLNLPTPRYHHHRLIRDETGKRLAKRDDSRAIRTFRAQGLTPAGIRQRLGL